MAKVDIYTDGGCAINPGGPGAYAAILVCGEHRLEVSGGFRSTTNNRMEVMAAIAALEALKKPSEVVIHSDSKYLVDAMTQGWVTKWKKKGWKLVTGAPRPNVDLWEHIMALCTKHRVRFTWVKGHAGHPENERCDAMATQTMAQRDLPADAGYESSLLCPPIRFN